MENAFLGSMEFIHVSMCVILQEDLDLAGHLWTNLDATQCTDDASDAESDRNKGGHSVQCQ